MDTRVHPHFFTADFDGVADENTSHWLYNADVYLLPYRSGYDPVLLARLRGVQVEARNSADSYNIWWCTVKHHSARDNEHSLVYLASFLL